MTARQTRSPKQVPTIPVDMPPELSRILVPMRSALAFILEEIGEGDSRLVRMSDMDTLGLTEQIRLANTLPAPTPPHVESFAPVAGGVKFDLAPTTILYRGHEATEFYRSATDDYATASYIGETTAFRYVDFTGEPGVPYFYWAVNRNEAGIKSSPQTHGLVAAAGGYDWNDVGGSGVPDSNADSTADSTAGSGVNVMPSRYASFEGDAMAPLKPSVDVTLARSATGTDIAYGAKGLKITTVNTSDGTLYFAPDSTVYNITLKPYCAWLVSIYMRSGTNGHEVKPVLKASDGTTYNPVNNVNTALTTTLARYSYVFDLTSADETTAVLGLMFNKSAANGRDVYVDAIVVEQQIGVLEVGSPFVPTREPLYDVFRDAAAVKQSSAGSNLLLNPGFEQNALGAVVNTDWTYGADAFLCDGWKIDAYSSYWSLQYQQNDSNKHGGNYNVMIRLRQSQSIPNDSTYYETRLVSELIPVNTGDVIVFGGFRRWDAGAALGAGVNAEVRLGIQVIDDDGVTVLTDQFVTSLTASSGAWGSAAVSTYTVPSSAGGGTPAYIRLQLNARVRNTGGAPWSTSTTYYIDARFDDVHIVRQTELDNEVRDGATYGRILGSDLSSGAHKLTVAGSDKRTGDARNVNQVFASNSGMAIPTNPLTAADVGATATISIAAGTGYIGSITYTWNSGSITGLAFSTKYYVYADDPNLAGGTLTFSASTAPEDASKNNGRVSFGSITTPADGGGGTGGAGGGGDWCVEAEAWVTPTKQAVEVKVGDLLDCLRDTQIVQLPVLNVREAEVVPCVEIRTSNGGRLVVSHSTPVNVVNGDSVAAAKLEGHVIWTVNDEGQVEQAMVYAVEDAGMRPVIPISLGGESFAATSDAGGGVRIITHNPSKP